jgi:hypothetical protein
MDIDEFTQKAKLHYEKHLKRVSDYQKEHPDKCSDKSKRYNAKLKNECPEKYTAMLEKKRAYYQNVRKPKLDALKSKSEPK